MSRLFSFVTLMAIVSAAGQEHGTPCIPSDLATIDTVAGGGGVGDGGLATQARLSLPGDVLAAPDGAIIIVDFGNHRVRRVDAVTGRISTIAGTGEPGYTGDGGLAVAARLARPENAAFGRDGALYIVDTHNHAVRRVDGRTGVISTVAGKGRAGFAGDGGPASEALFHQPEGVAIDEGGNIYIGDTLNGRIRRIDHATGLISTVAGTGEIGRSPSDTVSSEVHFQRLARIAVDGLGNVVIADSPNHVIQVLDVSAEIVRIVAGTGREGFSGDGGAAVDARLSFPEGVAVDSHGNIFFADLGNHRVRRIDAVTGIISTVAGSGDKGFSGDGGPALEARLWSPGRLAFDGRGNLLIADILNARVRHVDLRSGIIETVAGSGDLGDNGAGTDASLAIPGDLAHGRDALYIAEYGNRRVRAVDHRTGVITTVAGGGLESSPEGGAVSLELKLPEAIALAGERLLIADSLAHRIWEVDLPSGAATVFAGTGSPGYSGDGGPAAAAELNTPGGVAVGPDGSVYVADFGNRTIRVVDAEDATIRTLTLPSARQSPIQVAVTSLAVAGDALYWVGWGDPSLYRLSIESRDIQRIPVVLPYGDRDRQYQFADLSVVGSDVYLADTLMHRVVRLDLQSLAVEAIAGSGRQGFDGDDGRPDEAALFRPGALVALPDGRIFVGDSFNHRVRLVSSARSCGQ